MITADSNFLPNEPNIQYPFKSLVLLFVLPPRKPKWNGGVERGNAPIKYEFYAQYDGPPSFIPPS